MMVTGLEGVAGFSVGLGMKNSWVKRVYMDCRDWFGLVQDLMGVKTVYGCVAWTGNLALIPKLT